MMETSSSKVQAMNDDGVLGIDLISGLGLRLSLKG